MLPVLNKVVVKSSHFHFVAFPFGKEGRDAGKRVWDQAVPFALFHGSSASSHIAPGTSATRL